MYLVSKFPIHLKRFNINTTIVEYDRDLEEDIKGDLGGNLEKLMVSLLCANRENGWNVDDDQAKEDANRLHEVWAIDNNAIN